MGTIDRQWTRITCGRCGMNENDVVSQKGGMYSIGDWGTYRFAKFKIEVHQAGPKGDPTVTSAICTTCGDIAQVESGYDNPPWWPKRG